MEDLKLARQVEAEMVEQQPVVEDLRRDILIAACEYANRVRGTKHMMTLEEAKARIYKEMGWN